MNLFTRQSPYYHLLKYLLFLLKHPVYTQGFLNINRDFLFNKDSKGFVTFDGVVVYLEVGVQFLLL